MSSSNSVINNNTTASWELIAGIPESKHRQREDLRQRVLEAAEELFAKDGYRNISMRKVASELHRMGQEWRGASGGFGHRGGFSSLASGTRDTEIAAAIMTTGHGALRISRSGSFYSRKAFAKCGYDVRGMPGKVEGRC